jgi:glycosyltransferase involved in cell wall biosynthesis
VTPYPNLDQIVSGTLSYAMGAGKAIVSTPYAYARERLAQGRGILVEPGSTGALTAALILVAQDRELRQELGQRAYVHSRGMLWAEVADGYRRVFERVAHPVHADGPSIVPVALLAAARA